MPEFGRESGIHGRPVADSRELDRADSASIFGAVDTFRAWAEIDLDALTHNLDVLRARAGHGVACILVAKADAYGHGATAVCHHALRAGVDAVAVSSCDEALELRQNGVRSRILVMGAVLGEEALQTLDWDVEIGVSSPELGRLLERTARHRSRRTRVHLKLDTGMNRLGVSPVEALPVLESIRRSPHLELAGIMTHIAASDGARSPSAGEQLRRFDTVLTRARRARLVPPGCWIHVGNTAALLSGLRPLHNAVRIGVGAYGVAPGPALAELVERELKPVMSVRSKIVHLRIVPPGGQVGYDGSWTAKRASRIATLPLGYDDGVAWRLGGRGAVLVRGRRAPIVGRISMDYTSVDVTDVPAAELGDPVTLIGAAGDERILATDLAAEAGTIPYEILCSIGKRVRRTYTGGAAARRTDVTTVADDPPPEPASPPVPAPTT